MTDTFQTALTSDNYDSLRGTTTTAPWYANQFITLCLNTPVFEARVNGAISLSTYASILFDGVSVGAFGDIEIGETFFLSHTSNVRDYYYRGRIRLAADSSHIYINETSVNVTDNDYIFVVYDFDIWDRLSRMVGTTQYKDFDLAYQKLPPVACGLQTAYVQYDPTDSNFRIVFDVSSSYATDEYSSNVLTYQFTFVAGTYTVVSGALNTAFVTVDFDPNTEQWGQLVVTDSQGTAWTRRFYIRNHGSTDTPVFDFSGAQITGSLSSGWNASVSAWSGVENVLDQTFCVVWSQEWYNNVEGPIYNNIDCVGRFHQEENHGKGDRQYSYVDDVKFNIEGVCSQLNRLEQQDLTTVNISTAVVWDQISFDTPQRSIVHYLARHSTVLNLCDITFPNGFDLTYLFQYVANQGGNAFDAAKGIASTWNASVEFAPDGRIQVVRDTRFLVDKSGVVVVGDFDNTDFTSIDSLIQDSVNKTGYLDAYGGALYGGSVVSFRSRAPGLAADYAAAGTSLDGQILATGNSQNTIQAELNYRAGQQLAIENLTFTQQWKAAHGGYHFLTPSRGQRVTHTLTSETNVRDLAFDTSNYWQITQVSINHDNKTGTREVSTTEELEPPTGDSGDTIPMIAPGTQTNPVILSPLDPYPAIPDDPGNYTPADPVNPNPYPPLQPPKNGNTTIYAQDSDANTSRSVVAYAHPVWTGATPIDLGSFKIKAVTFDLTTTAPPIGAYLLASDGTNSAIWYTSDAFARPTVWTEGATFSGVYSQIKSAGTPGSVLLYSTVDTTTTTVYDFTISNWGFAASVPAVGQVTAVYTPGVGWTNGNWGPDGFGHYFRDNLILKAFSGTVIQYTMYYSATYGPNPIGTPNTPDLYADSSIIKSGTAVNTTNGIVTFLGSASVSSLIQARVLVDGETSSGALTGSSTITKIVLVTGTGNGGVRYSSDYGATVGSPVSIGTSPGGVGGFDMDRIGDASLAASSGQVKIATTLGGSYSNAPGGTLSSGQPVSIVIPYRRLPHGAVQYSASDPDYILGSSAIISSSCLWDVDGTSGTKTNINPVAGATCIGPNLLTVWQSSSIRKIAVVVSVGGANKVYVFNGASWSLSKTVTNPVFLRCRRNDPNGTQLFLIDGSTLYVSTNWGVSWKTRTTPSSDDGTSMDIFY